MGIPDAVRFEQERLRALEFYIAKKDSTLEAEIDGFMAKLYEKYVPAQTREYIESMESRDERPPRQQRPRPTRPVRPGTSENGSASGGER